MKLAIIGSRSIVVKNLETYLPQGVSEIVSGGARGVDTVAADYAKRMGITLTEVLPEYARHKRAAPLMRNKQIAEYADEVLAFWDGSSKGTMHTVELFRKLGKKATVIQK